MIEKLSRPKIQLKTLFKTLTNFYICLFCFFSFLQGISPLFGAVDYSWTGSSGDSFWENSGNWVPSGSNFPGRPPDVDTAVFNQGRTTYPLNLGQDIFIPGLNFETDLVGGLAFSPTIGTFGHPDVLHSPQINVALDKGTNSVLTINSLFSTTNLTIDFNLASGQTNVPATVAFGNTLTIADMTIQGGNLTASGERIVDLRVGNPISGTILVQDKNILMLSNTSAISGATGLTLADATLRLNVTGISESVPITVGGGGGIIDTEAFDVTWSGNISGAGLLSKTSSTGTATSKLILSGTNSYGSTAVLVGVLQGINTSISGPVAISQNANLIFVQTSSGTANNAISGLGSVTVANVGGTTNLNLGGTSTYSGGTTLQSGILSVTNTGNLGGTSAGTLSIGAATFQILSSNTITCPVALTGAAIIDTVANNPTIAGTITGTGSLEKISSGTLTLSPNPTTSVASSYSGGTTVTAGILQGTTVTLQGAISVADNAQVIFNQTAAGTYGGVITDSANPIRSVVIKAGTSIVTFTGINTYSGGTEVMTGSLQGSATSPSAIQGDILVDSGATVIFQQGGTGTYPTGNPGSVHGAGGLTMVGPGTLVLTDANAYSGTTTITGGVLSIDASANIGSGPLTMGGGSTLLLTTGMNITKTVSLVGAATLNVQGSSSTITGTIGGGGPFTKTGPATLILAGGGNSYAGGTVVNQGVLQGTTATIASIGGVEIANGANLTFTQGGSGTYSGVISNFPSSGTGSVIINGGTVIFSGANTYSGGTTINTGILQGTTTSLHGDFTLLGTSTLSFSQATSSPSYTGLITSTSAATTLSVAGGGSVTMTNNNSSFLGGTIVNGGTLVMNGNLSNSFVRVEPSSILSGTGSVGGINNLGTITPGVDGAGTLTANGNVTFQSGSFLNVLVAPTTGTLLNVTGSATLAGTLDVTVIPGFHGINESYVVLKGASVTGTFSSLRVSDSGFAPTLSYTATEVILGLRALTPFIGFPYANANERSVGNNLDALSLAGELSPDFVSIIDSFQGQSVEEINNALDQMHPAALSALAQTQVELGAELLSVMHHKRGMGCGCDRKNQFWVEPFGNWLHVKKQGMEIGFHATTRGVAMGYEKEFFGCWTVGLGGAYSATDLKWSLDRGYSYVKGAWGSLYSDLMIDRFYLGLSAFGGKDWYQTQRQLHFVDVDRQASSKSSGLDTGVQMSTAYYFGMRNFVIYPYALVDYLYLNNKGFKESGALSLDLDVNPYISSTLRVETGGAFRFVDRNTQGTICISPFLGMGYVWERPLNRTPYSAKFSGETISFTTWGWDKVWQMISLKMGLAIAYRCFTLDSEFIADISSKGGTPIVNQRANFRMSYGF